MSEQKFEPFQRVLVRDNDYEKWSANIFSHYENDDDYPYKCMGSGWKKCIPYEGNEHLIRTTNNPKPKWEPKKGEAVFVRDSDEGKWFIRLFIKKCDGKYLVSGIEEMKNGMMWEQCKPYNAPKE